MRKQNFFLTLKKKSEIGMGKIHFSRDLFTVIIQGIIMQEQEGHFLGYQGTYYCLNVRLDCIIGKIRVALSLHSPLISAFEFHVKYLKQFTLLIGLYIERNLTFVQKNKICLQPLEHNYFCVKHTVIISQFFSWQFMMLTDTPQLDVATIGLLYIWLLKTYILCVLLEFLNCSFKQFNRYSRTFHVHFCMIG